MCILHKIQCGLHPFFCQNHIHTPFFHVGKTFAFSRKNIWALNSSSLHPRRTVALRKTTDSCFAVLNFCDSDPLRAHSSPPGRRIYRRLYKKMYIHSLSYCIIIHLLCDLLILFPRRIKFHRLCPSLADLCILIHRTTI